MRTLEISQGPWPLANDFKVWERFVGKPKVVLINEIAVADLPASGCGASQLSVVGLASGASLGSGAKWRPQSAAPDRRPALSSSSAEIVF